MPKKPAAANGRALNIAIQGGGSHGAFAWGILDTLLEDGRFDIASVTATSAGAMNAVVLAYGMMKGGREGARALLETYWKRISDSRGPFSPVSMNAMKKFWDPFNLLGERMFQWFDVMTHVASPYEFNPWNFNPLRDALKATVDFDELRKDCPFRLFLSTTDVRTGKVRVFRTEEVTADVVLAAACLPYLFQAVETQGGAYWDGGYVANPALWPTFTEELPDDILICHMNPLNRAAVPKTSAEIMDRLNEISFNASLMAELRAIAFVQRLVQQDQLKDEVRDRYRDIRIHAIKADQALGDLGVSTKFKTDWPFLTELKAKGQADARAWLTAHGDQVGVSSSVDIAAEYLA
jgi:NTE family protein